MSVAMHLPIFGDLPQYLPARSSPLSSSPIRASSPLQDCSSPADSHEANCRATQSSPIRQPRFRYNARPVKANPIMQKREAAQENRRKLFLKNVRQRAEDQKWAQRGGEQELLKLEWLSETEERRLAKEGDWEGFIPDAEIEDFAQLLERTPNIPDGMDEMMVDEMEQQEDAEIEGFLQSMSQITSSGESCEPDCPQFSDGDEYDTLFADYFSQRDATVCDTSIDAEMT